MSTALTQKDFFSKDSVKRKFEELLGKRASAFITSVLQITQANALLANADPMSVYNAAAIAATMDLPLNQNLGFAYIVPYNERQKDDTFKQVAQFQMGYRGFIQLAQRSGQFRTISASPIYQGQIISNNPLTGIEFDFSQKESDVIVGYAAYFKLLNGFEKTLYMSAEELKKHGARFSQTYKKGFGPWKDDFDGMAIKTVIKLLLSKYAPLSIEMQTAVITDQSVVKDADTREVTYVDNTDYVDVDKEQERVIAMLSDCNTVQEVEALQAQIPDVDVNLFDNRKKELANGKV